MDDEDQGGGWWSSRTRDRKSWVVQREGGGGGREEEPEEEEGTGAYTDLASNWVESSPDSAIPRRAWQRQYSLGPVLSSTRARRKVLHREGGRARGGVWAEEAVHRSGAVAGGWGLGSRQYGYQKKALVPLSALSTRGAGLFHGVERPAPLLDCPQPWASMATTSFTIVKLAPPPAC